MDYSCRLLLLLALSFKVFSNKIGKETSFPYEEKYFDQTLDHFNFVSYADRTFKQRYLVNGTVKIS